MKIETKRIFPEDYLAQHRVRDMRPDEVLTAFCETDSEFDAARQTAKLVKANEPRIDGFKYRVQSSKKDNTITVSLFKEE